MCADQLFIENLELNTIIGVLDHERVTKQRVIIHLQLWLDLHNAAENDALEETVNYADVVMQLSTYIENTAFLLIEKLAENICTWLFQHFPIDKVSLRLEKPEALAMANVGVMIERQRP